MLTTGHKVSLLTDCWVNDSNAGSSKQMLGQEVAEDLVTRKHLDVTL